MPLGEPVLVAVLEPLVVSLESLVVVGVVPDPVLQPSAAPVANPAPVLDPLVVSVVPVGSMLAPPAALG
jgi:hypothetical protein